MPSQSVYFRFQGRIQTEKTPAIAIAQDTLAKFPDSLLTKLAQDEWKQDDTSLGSNSWTAIVVKPYETPCAIEWVPEMAPLIKLLYESTVQPVRPKLPRGVEVENALIVLDYFGLQPTTDLRTFFDLSEVEEITKLRASLFYQNLDDIEKVKQHILDDLNKDPWRIKYYLVSRNTDINLDLIRNSNRKFSGLLVRLGDCIEDIDRFAALFERGRTRHRLVSVLQNKVGLQVRFESPTTCSTGPFSDGICSDFPYPDNEKCYVAVRKAGVDDIESAHYSFEFVLEEMWVLRVEIPDMDT